MRDPLVGEQASGGIKDVVQAGFQCLERRPIGRPSPQPVSLQHRHALDLPSDSLFPAPQRTTTSMRNVTSGCA